MKKLFSLLVMVAAFVGVTNAAVVRGTITVVGPYDLTLDFNNDGAPDFKVSNGYVGLDDVMQYGGITWYDCSPTNNMVMGDSWDSPVPLTVGTAVNGASNFAGEGDASLNGFENETLVLPLNSDIYYGFKIGNNNYGWARITIATGSGEFAYKVTWHEIYYETNAGTGIAVGSKGTSSGIESLNASLTLYPNPTADCAIVDGLNGSEALSLYDFNGRLVSVTRPQGVSSANIDLNGLNAGCYLLVVKDGNKVQTMTINKQ